MGLSFHLSTWEDAYSGTDDGGAAFAMLRRQLENWVFTAHPLPSWEKILTCRGIANTSTPAWVSEQMLHLPDGPAPDWDALREGRLTIPTLPPLPFTGYGNLPYTLVDDTLWRALRDVLHEKDPHGVIDIVPLQPAAESHEFPETRVGDEKGVHRDIYSASWVLWNFAAFPVATRRAADELMHDPDFPDLAGRKLDPSDGFRAVIAFLAYQSLRTRQPVTYRH